LFIVHFLDSLSTCFFYVLSLVLEVFFSFFFFNDTATTEIYTLSLHDALPIRGPRRDLHPGLALVLDLAPVRRSEEHTSELQSPMYLVCRLLLEKKKKNHNHHHNNKKEPKSKTKLKTILQT